MAMQISRRNFVAGAATVGAMAAFGMAGCSNKGDGKAESKAEEYDIVIVGAGGAGMSAAIAAHDAGVEKVVVLEKEGNVGGNTNFSSSGMNASETKFQKAQGIDDSNELFAQETLDGGHDTGNPELVHFMCDNSAGAIDWLDSLGITLDNITMTGGMSVKRCHRPTDGSAVGKTIVPGLQKAVEDRGIEIKTNCDVKELVQADDGSITGVKTDKGDYSAKAVILAAGGLGSNPDMITKYRPDLEGYVSTNQPGATGDGYAMAEAVGAQLIQMDQIQIHPTVEQSSSMLIAEGLRGGGAILVNSEGKRFFNESRGAVFVDVYNAMTSAGGVLYTIFDQSMIDDLINKGAVLPFNAIVLAGVPLKALPKTLEMGYERGWAFKADTVKELAQQIGVPPENLESSMKRVNEFAKTGVDEEFSRKPEHLRAFNLNKGPYYALKGVRCFFLTLGGVTVTPQFEAKNPQGNVIPNLYVVGQDIGGLYDSSYDLRCEGSASSFAMTSGRVAAENAIKAIEAGRV